MRTAKIIYRQSELGTIIAPKEICEIPVEDWSYDDEVLKIKKEAWLRF